MHSLSRGSNATPRHATSRPTTLGHTPPCHATPCSATPHHVAPEEVTRTAPHYIITHQSPPLRVGQHRHDTLGPKKSKQILIRVLGFVCVVCVCLCMCVVLFFFCLIMITEIHDYLFYYFTVQEIMSTHSLIFSQSSNYFLVQLKQ